jgi:hypothetical protein
MAVQCYSTGNRARLVSGSPAVHGALRSPGLPLDARTRSLFGPRFGHDFSRVRIHAGPDAAESASAVNARAYTVGDDIVFGEGRHAPDSPAGLRLLAHELAHVVQQSKGGSGSGAESRAAAAADSVIHGEPAVSIGGAPFGLYRQGKEEGEKPGRPSTTPTLHLDWSQFPLALQPPGVFAPPQPGATLSPPSILAPPQRPSLFSFPPQRQAPPSFALPGSDWRSSLGLNPLKARTDPGLPPKAATAPVPAAPKSGSSTSAIPSTPPSRIPVTTIGQFSLGLKLGLPGQTSILPGTPPSRRPEPLAIPGSAPSRLSEVLYQAEIMQQTLTGKIPTGWDAIDKGQLAKVIWSIFSTHLAPDVAAKLTSKVSGPPGATRELNLVLNGDFKGAGVSFSAQF